MVIGAEEIPLEFTFISTQFQFLIELGRNLLSDNIERTVS